jgi:hypothetical protein
MPRTAKYVGLLHMDELLKLINELPNPCDKLDFYIKLIDMHDHGNGAHGQIMNALRHEDLKREVLRMASHG